MSTTERRSKNTRRKADSIGLYHGLVECKKCGYEGLGEKYDGFEWGEEKHCITCRRALETTWICRKCKGTYTIVLLGRLESVDLTLIDRKGKPFY